MKYVFVLFLLVVGSARAEVVTELKTFLKSELGNSAKKTKETFSLNADQQKALKAIAPSASDSAFTFYFGKSDAGALETACTVVPQDGKEGPMTVGVCFNASGMVKSVRIMEFQEDHGKPVKELSFLKQFEGKNVTNAFKVGDDVDGISGATISSKAVAEAVRKASFGFGKFVAKK